MRHPSRPLAAPVRALLALALAAAGPAFAADAAPPRPAADSFWHLAEAGIEAGAAGLAFGADALEALAGPRGSERIVQGAPFCADAVHEQVQWLPDPAGGAPNRIVKKTGWRICRDGEGRTRQEVERGGRALVYLRDPATRETWVLDPARKTARLAGRVRIDGLEGLDADSAREFAQRMRDWAREVAERARRGIEAARAPLPPLPPATPLAPGAPAAPATAPTPAQPPEAVWLTPPAGGERRTEVQVIRLPRDPAFAAALPPPLPVRSFAHAAAPRGPGVVTPLPAREIGGVRAHGERTTWTIEAGRVGNERPIEIVREVWTSPELVLTLASRDFDPREGERLYRLENLKRGEPDAALMRVPADYSRAGERRPAEPTR